MQIIIIGAGIWGLSCAYACARQGDTVTVYDANTVASGASGGIVGALSPYTPDEWNAKKKFQFEALDSAPTFWAEVDARSAHPSGFGQIGRIQPLVSPRTANLAKARELSSQSLWQGRYHWKIQPCPSYLDERAAPFGIVHDTLSGRIYPRHAVLSLAKACRDLGVTLHENTPVTQITDHQISGPWGQATADAIILAAGLDGFDLLRPFTPHSPGTGVKGQAALLDIHLPDQPQIYADGIYIIPHSNGTTAVGSTSEKTWDHPGTDAQLDALIAKARTLFPALEPAPILQRWSGLRPKARRRAI